MSNSAESVLATARNEIGYCRWDDSSTGTIYGRWFADYSRVVYYGSSGVPYCAMFVSWVFNRVGAKCAGVPGAYCPSMLAAAKKKGATVPNKSAVPGDVVYFDWDGGVVDHVGIVEINHGSYLTTIEGNTTGADGRSGSVARRRRAFSTVSAIVRPQYEAQEAIAQGLAVDGVWGPATTRAVQKVLGCKVVDGVVSDQPISNYSHVSCASSAAWQWVRNASGGSAMVKAIQGRIGSEADGYFGPLTAGTLQKYILVHGYSVGSCGVDAYFGHDSCAGMQRALNAGELF